ncbi:MAG: diguanylate cyclase [Planctomycetota bacterium]|nr:diguanylate cyclase [Planctomycetota bacterium]
MTKPAGLARLPVDRQDDLGVIARAVQRLAAHSLRQHHEARHLRRTLDHRVAEATRVATRQLRQQALRDPLTDLGNRRFLDEQLDPLLSSHRAAGADMACVLIDLDNFKAVNDTLGHGAGDDLLLFTGGLIRGSCRQEDHAVRLGGDEFVVLLPGCDITAAARFAQQILALFRQHARAALPPHCQASLSIGVASLDHDGPAGGAELLERADARLYAAKRSGKDRVLS